MKRLLFCLLIALTINGRLVIDVAAAPGLVSVLLPDLTDGQMVGGLVSIRVVAAAPAPIAKVEYFVDSSLLAKTVIAPYTYAWDTTQLTPGTHALKVSATDGAGNTGQVQVRLNIVPPLAVTFSAPEDAIPIGTSIKLNANITALNTVAQIDLRVDNQVVGRAQTPPFELTLNTSQIQPGVHVVTLHVADDQGNQASAGLPLRFESPNADYTWLSVWFILGLIAALIAAGFAIWRTIQVTRQSYLRNCRLELCNLGNIPTRYELLADDPARVLKFRLLLNGVALPQEPLIKPAPRASKSAPRASKPAATGSSGVRTAGKTFVNIAYTLSTILPGPIGQKLSQWAVGVQNVDYTPQRLQYTGQQVKSLGGGQAAGTSEVMPEAPTTAQVPELPQAPTLNITPGAWYTPYLQPGDKLALNLMIDPGRPVQTQHYTFHVNSRAVEPEQATPLIETGQLQVASVSLLKYCLPFFIIAGVVIGVSVIVALFLASTGAL